MANEFAFNSTDTADRVIEDRRGLDPIEAGRVLRLAQIILEKEPAEIRVLMRNDPALLAGWLATLKTEHAGLSSKLAVTAMDHIRLSTLCPLKFLDD